MLLTWRSTVRSLSLNSAATALLVAPARNESQYLELACSQSERVARDPRRSLAAPEGGEYLACRFALERRRVSRPPRPGSSPPPGTGLSSSRTGPLGLARPSSAGRRDASAAVRVSIRELHGHRAKCLTIAVSMSLGISTAIDSSSVQSCARLLEIADIEHDLDTGAELHGSAS